MQDLESLKIKKREYYKKYYEEHREYFRLRNTSPEKKEYYRNYYLNNKEYFKYKSRYKPLVKTIVKQSLNAIFVHFD